MGAICSREVLKSGPPLSLSETYPDSVSLLTGTVDGAGVNALASTTTSLFVGYNSGKVSQHALDGASLNSGPFHTWDAHESRAVTSLAVGGGLLASASRDSTVGIWRYQSPHVAGVDTRVGVLKGHSLTVSSVDVNTDGSRVATGGRDCFVKVWDVEGGGGCKEVLGVHVPQNVVTCVQWGKGGGSGNVLYQGGEDLRVRLWDVRVGLSHPATTLEGFTYFPLCLDTHPDGVHLVTSSKGFNGVGCELRVWDVRGGVKGALLDTLQGHHQDTTSCLFTNTCGGEIASASKDGTVRIWNWKVEDSATSDTKAVAVLSKAGSCFSSLAALSTRQSKKTTTLAAGCAEGGVSFFRT